MKLTLYKNGSAYFEKEVFVLCDEPLQIEISADPEFDNLYAVCDNNKAHLPYKIKDGMLTIPPSFMSPGELRITLQQVKNGEVVKRWNAERVTIKALDGKHELIPELVVVKEAIKELYELVKKNNNI